MPVYAAKRKAFLLAHPYCQATIRVLGLEESAVIEWQGLYRHLDGHFTRIPEATEIHHTKGRAGLYLDEEHFLAVCRTMHDKIHQRPLWAKTFGFLA